MSSWWKSLAVAGAVLAMASCGENPGIRDDQAAVVDQNAAASGIAHGKPGAPVDLTFKLGTEPAIGQSLTIAVTLVPRAASPLLRASFLASDGLAVLPPAPSIDHQQVLAGSAYEQQITVVPQSNGVFHVAVVVSMGRGSEVMARTFMIPVVVGPLPADKAQVRKPVAIDATGQAIQVTPAEETRR